MTDEKIGFAQGSATEIHRGINRKFGKKEPYINHPMRVSERCKDKISKCIAWLHDTVEDSKDRNATRDLIHQTFPAFVASGVDALTRSKDENYAEYIIRLLKCPRIVLTVKLADLEDNMSDLKEGSMKDKYRLAHHIIYSQLAPIDWDQLLNSKEEIANVN